jgi:hypothetical protein
MLLVRNDESEYGAHYVRLQRHGPAHINDRHRRIVCAMAKAIRDGIPGVQIRDDERVLRICSGITTSEGALKRRNSIRE